MDYRCSLKFTDLQVHLQSRLLYNCEKSYPERVNLDWLEANPGKLFHTETMVHERKLMSENKPCDGCYYGCYKNEMKGLESFRLLYKKEENKKIHNDPLADLETLRLFLSTDCNLACVYCSPQFSTSWQREIAKGGVYTLGEHSIENDTWSNMWSKIKQKDRSQENRFFKLLLREIELAKSLRKVSLLGGEPLLNNQLFDLIERLSNKEIEITTGLGVGIDRLKRIADKTKEMNVKFMISAESTGRVFEFIRYGSSWQEFKEKIRLLVSMGHKVRFMSTISNICLFDLHNFYNEFGHSNQIMLNTLSEKPFLEPHVIDDRSKEMCQNNIEKIQNIKHRDFLSKMLSATPSESQRKMLGSYLVQLSKRRGLPLDFLPDHFLHWCGAN